MKKILYVTVFELFGLSWWPLCSKTKNNLKGGNPYMTFYLKIQPNLCQEDKIFYKYIIINVTIIIWGKKNEKIILKLVLGFLELKMNWTH